MFAPKRGMRSRARMEDRSSRLAPPPDVSVDAVRSALAASGTLVPDGERCPTCQAAIRARYCAVCGEKRPKARPRTIVGFLRAAMARVLDADNRLYRSLRALVARPGALTEAYLEGRRRPYLGPIQLFVLINALFYLLAVSPIGVDTFRTPLRFHVGADNFYHDALAQRWVNETVNAPEGWSYEKARAAADSLGEVGADSSADAALPPQASQEALRDFRDYADRFDRQAQWLSKSLIFLFIPALAGWFWLIYPSRWRESVRRGAVPYVVQATHVMGAVLLILATSVVSALTYVAGAFILGAGVSAPPKWLADVHGSMLLFAYVALALRRVHGSSWIGAGIRGVVTPFVFLQILLLYRAVLFFIGFYTA